MFCLEDCGVEMKENEMKKSGKLCYLNIGKVSWKCEFEWKYSRWYDWCDFNVKKIVSFINLLKYFCFKIKINACLLRLKHIFIYLCLKIVIKERKNTPHVIMDFFWHSKAMKVDNYHGTIS